MSYIADNMKVLLWLGKGELSKRTYSEYIDHVAYRCGIEPVQFREMLLDERTFTPSDETELKGFFADQGFDLSAIRYDFLFSNLLQKRKEELIAKNLKHLLSSFEWGENAEFVDAIGINPSTLSRWKQGKNLPDPVSQERICSYFGYYDVGVLVKGFLFLGLVPVSITQKKQSIKGMIDGIGRDDFERIYPALVKLLR